MKFHEDDGLNQIICTCYSTQGTFDLKDILAFNFNEVERLYNYKGFDSYPKKFHDSLKKYLKDHMRAYNSQKSHTAQNIIDRIEDLYSEKYQQEQIKILKLQLQSSKRNTKIAIGVSAFVTIISNILTAILT